MAAGVSDVVLDQVDHVGDSVTETRMVVWMVMAPCGWRTVHAVPVGQTKRCQSHVQRGAELKKRDGRRLRVNDFFWQIWQA